jgi:catechol 2,3-dioxygenase-like lactoylglutathione lyase family enzyme
MGMFTFKEAFSSFSAPDLAAMKRFYGEALGFPVEELPDHGLVLRLEGTTVFIYPSTEYNAPEHTVLNFMVDDIEVAVDDLAKRGIHMEQYPDFKTDAKGISRNDGSMPGPKAIAWFKDPADHILAVMQG